jgi:hypothetical protein
LPVVVGIAGEGGVGAGFGTGAGLEARGGVATGGGIAMGGMIGRDGANGRERGAPAPPPTSTDRLTTTAGAFGDSASIVAGGGGAAGAFGAVSFVVAPLASLLSGTRLVKVLIDGILTIPIRGNGEVTPSRLGVRSRSHRRTPAPRIRR